MLRLHSHASGLCVFTMGFSCLNLTFLFSSKYQSSFQSCCSFKSSLFDDLLLCLPGLAHPVMRVNGDQRRSVLISILAGLSGQLLPLLFFILLSAFQSVFVCQPSRKICKAQTRLLTTLQWEIVLSC